MSKPFDATFKDLLQMAPLEWAAFVGVAGRSVKLVDADVSTVTAAADKVMLVRADEGDRIQHFDFQSGPDASLPRRSHFYSTLLEERHGLPVDTVVVLARPEANLKALNGLYERRLPGESEPYLQFRYRVIRLWELPVEPVLKAGLTVLPVAPICAVQQNELPAVIKRMKERLDGGETDEATGGKLWTATNILLGLRWEKGLGEQLLQGVRGMKESVTYQAIVDEGRFEEARNAIRIAGEEKFNTPPPPHVQTALENILDLQQLHGLVKRILHVGSWEELIPPAAPPTPTKEK
jgi:predicted transposase YdaD